MQTPSAGSSQQVPSHLAHRAPGQLHTPSQSFSESSPMTASDLISRVSNEKRSKEEVESAKSRLSDQKFEIREYPDPLLPRQTIVANPKGVSPEMEGHLLDVIAKIKSDD